MGHGVETRSKEVGLVLLDVKGSASRQGKNGLYRAVQIESNAFEKDCWFGFGDIGSQKLKEF